MTERKAKAKVKAEAEAEAKATVTGDATRVARFVCGGVEVSCRGLVWWERGCALRTGPDASRGKRGGRCWLRLAWRLVLG